MDTTLEEQGKQFASLGATHYHDAHYPDNFYTTGRLFTRHYFNANGTEIGLVIPDMFPVGGGVQVFDSPRIWHIEHDLHKLTC